MGSTGLMYAAEKHLRLLADDPDASDSLARYYVGLAHEYGVPAERITALSGISAARVQTYLER